VVVRRLAIAASALLLAASAAAVLREPHDTDVLRNVMSPVTTVTPR